MVRNRKRKPHPESYANVRNENVSDDHEASWTTFPERLEDNGVPWKIYQNELSINTGLAGEQDSWLANFTDNPIEWFSQYQIRYYTGYQKYLKSRVEKLPLEITETEKRLSALAKNDAETEKVEKILKEKQATLKISQDELIRWSPENFEKLTQREKNIHQKAFTTNVNDPDYRHLATVDYDDGDIINHAKAPQGDILHQFRADVKNEKLPTVSWLVAPENFSDHPTSPWYGAWYVSEVMDILTKNPEVWKKTIFILCYDENDGYFDHVPPFVVPNPYQKNSGLVSEGIDAKVEYVTLEHDMAKKEKKESRESPIGLGYRVPLLIASPWNRGGNVNSEVFDHTSILQFLEKFVSHKSGKQIKETNISEWRRTICGDLTSTFKPYDGKEIPLPKFVERTEFMESIFNAQFKKLPNGYKALTKKEIDEINVDSISSPVMPSQEKGTRPACPLPYELYADGSLDTAKNAFQVRLKTGNGIFGKQAAGAPFAVYAYGDKEENVKVRNYAVKPGDALTDSWDLNDFTDQNYHLALYGPNGFFREYMGNSETPKLGFEIDYQLDKAKKPTGNILLKIKYHDKNKKLNINITDNAYKAENQRKTLSTSSAEPTESVIILNLAKNFNWYDFSITIDGSENFLVRLAGHVETGKESQSDPYMGQSV
ncbi:alkaline phosphatase family protein [Dyadobacter sp. NIV53]|uniref:alkaline phosphatase family protein n=1 Tax=Dyadobacter sp. NIV53 TaxID=2861765 RepID=UPI00286E0CC6|nr:alkaline phosphatase family protein [Dyadobacter sp. NIV53]